MSEDLEKLRDEDYYWQCNFYMKSGNFFIVALQSIDWEPGQKITWRTLPDARTNPQLLGIKVEDIEAIIYVAKKK